MQKLHLVGTTTDQAGLILSARRGARSGSYTLVLDDALAQAVEELRAKQEEAGPAAGRGGAGDRTESRLPVGEIQLRLRRGRSVKDVARDAGVDPEWVERFAAPVFAEQAKAIAKVQSTFLRRARLGPSGMRVGDAVRRNLAERSVVMSPDEYAQAWTTVQRPDGRWMVKFTFQYRGGAKTLKYEVKTNGDVSTSDSFTSGLSYITPPKRPTPKPKSLPPAADLSAKRAVVGSGFRPDGTAKPTSRPAKEREKMAAAMTKAAHKRAIEGEKAAARKSRERSQMLARREREARIEAQRREREAAARAREAAAAARLAAAEQAEREKKAAVAAAARQAERDAARRAARMKVKAQARAVAAKKKAAEKDETAKKAPAKQAPAKKSPAHAKAAPAKPAPTKATPATKAASAKAAATKAPPPSRPPARTRAERFAEGRGEEAPARPKRARPSPGDRVPAEPPRRAAAAARPAASERVAAERPAAAERVAAKRAAASEPPEEPTRPPAHARPAADAPRRPAATSGLSGAAVDVYGPEATRALFRAGLAQPADPDEAGDTAPNGAARQRPPGARRTRPLRAN